MNGIDAIKEYRNNKDKYLPLVDHEKHEFNGYTNQDTAEKNEYEIERKFLIRYPDIDLLEQVCTRQLSIAQTYLVTEQNISRRIRMQESSNKTEYWYNEKRKITDITRIEDEKEISKIEYENLYKEKFPNSNTIYKTRYCIPSGKHIFEIDVFRDWTEWAYAEVELASEEESYQLPECVSVIKEVTHDKRYTNRSLAINGFDI